MAIIKPTKGQLYVKWLSNDYFDAAASIEVDSCEKFYTKKDIFNHMYSENGAGFVVSHYLTPVAYMLYECDADEGVYTIDNLVTLKEFRSMGIGTMLVKRLIDKLSERMHTIEVTVRESNTYAQNFFSKRGLTATGVLTNYFSNELAEGVETEDGYKFRFERKCIKEEK